MLGTCVNELIKWKYETWERTGPQKQELLSLKFIIFWEFHFVQFISFLKAAWTGTWLLPNLCRTCWVRSRRRIMSAHVRNIKRGLERCTISFEGSCGQWGVSLHIQPRNQAAVKVQEPTISVPWGEEQDMLTYIQMWRACSFCVCFFVTFMGLYIMTLFHKGKL
jgi:hypothetical protein